MGRRRVIAGFLAFGSVALAIAGLVIWREMSPSIAVLEARCGAARSLGCGLAFPPPYRLHPLRAELLWAAATVAGIVAAGVMLVPHARRSDAVASAS